MSRVSGTPEARKAWFVLRGPFLLAYLFYLLRAITTPVDRYELMIWQGLSEVIIAATLIGSFSSYMVVAQHKPQKVWRWTEMLEVTGLRALVAFELFFGFWSVATPELSLRVSYSHLMIAAIALGILMNMAWRRGKGGVPHEVR